MAGPATPWEHLLSHIIPGEPVSAQVTNRTPLQLGRRTQYLFDLLQDLAAGEAIFLHNVNLEEAALVGHVVYYDATADEYKRSLAAVEYNSAAGWFDVAESAYVVGMVYAKTANDRGHILLSGALRSFDLSNTIADGSPTESGPYFLSMSTPGKLTKYRPPVSVYVLYNRGDGGFHFQPTPRNVLEDHVHYRYQLTAAPAGTPNCMTIDSGQRYHILDPNPDLPGWLPADHAIFNSTAPAGAKFGYNLSQHPDLLKVWPPIPFDSVYVERNGKAVPGNTSACPTILVDVNGIWWFDDCYGAAPWPPEYPGCSSESSSSSSSSSESCQCHTPLEYLPGHDYTALDEMELVLWFTKMIFKTDQTVVTSLDPCSENEPIQVLNCDGEPASTGKLCLAFDWSKLQEEYPIGGFKGVKNLVAGKIQRGPLVTGVKPGLRAAVEGVGTEDVDWSLDPVTGLYSGNLQVGLESLTDVSEGIVDLVAFDNIREEYDDVDKLFYLHFPAGRSSSFRGRINLSRINLSGGATPDDLTMYLWFWFVSRQAGSSAIPKLTATYRRYPRPETVQALPGPSAEQDIVSGGWDPSASFTAAKQYIEKTTPGMAAQIGETIFFTLGWDGVTPAGLTEGFGIMRLGYRVELVTP